MFKKLFLVTYILNIAIISMSQTIEFPVWTVKSHENLDIESIELNTDGVIIHLIVMSEIDEGAWFCADKSISILNSKNKFQSEIIKSENIPVCPDSHSFTSKGEILRFSLFFPAIPENITRIDLRENCNNECFFFKDIVLDPILNKEIRDFEKAVDDYSRGNIKNAIEGFEKLISICKEKESYRYSHSLSILPILYEETQQLLKAENTYREILNSNIDDRSLSGNKNEYYSNFKHKAAIRLSILLEKAEKFEDAISILNLSETKFPLQHIDSEKTLRNKDHFLIVKHKIDLLSKRNNLNEFLKLSITESLNNNFGEIPASTSQLISDIIIDKIGKSEFTDLFKTAIKNLYVDENKASITFILMDQDFKISNKKQISKIEVQKAFKELPFYKILSQ